ncbi:hypothetical protein K435DRAFT_749328 [Dendrothele bispora CBS 962.96]|uniref:Flavin reductase like domain-containing protein n=1 Tax=Dendrothele bispora (strain CBS 962.96) TaxID=1314807 RepID=A0A4S8MID3_DENBC|nr:hypothetical protein K435DRAFT_749328 [Dendrothele bispora CBS 962.96]
MKRVPIRRLFATYRPNSFHYTQSPSPSWQLGQGAPEFLEKHASIPKKTWIMSETSSKDTYRILTSCIVPRPIAFVSTLATDGTPNLAPFSYFSMVSHNPPLLSISFNLSPKRPKDTRENILSTKEFTVNIISEAFVEAANVTSVEAPASVNEWNLSGLTMESSAEVKPAMVKESHISMECELHFSHDITDLKSSEITNTLVLGLIKRVHVRESVLTADRTQVNPAHLNPVARLGGLTYAKLGDGFDLARPSWKTIRETVEKKDKTAS